MVVIVSMNNLNQSAKLSIWIDLYALCQHIIQLSLFTFIESVRSCVFYCLRTIQINCVSGDILIHSEWYKYRSTDFNYSVSSSFQLEAVIHLANMKSVVIIFAVCFVAACNSSLLRNLAFVLFNLLLKTLIFL